MLNRVDFGVQISSVHWGKYYVLSAIGFVAKYTFINKLVSCVFCALCIVDLSEWSNFISWVGAEN